MKQIKPTEKFEYTAKKVFCVIKSIYSLKLLCLLDLNIPVFENEHTEQKMQQDLWSTDCLGPSNDNIQQRINLHCILSF